MSRTRKRHKGPGFEFWGRRAMSNAKGVSPGPKIKRLTHQLERARAKRQLRDGREMPYREAI